MFRILKTPFLGCLAVCGLTACARAPDVEAGGDVAPTIPVNANWIPVGTTVDLRLNDAVGTVTSHAGDRFTATVTAPVLARDGETVLGAGSVAYGHVTDLHTAPVPGAEAVVHIDFDSLDTGGRRVPFDASIASVQVRNAPIKPPARTMVRDVAIGAVAGGALGSVVSGFMLSRTLIGALIGGGAGAGMAIVTRGTESELPAGSIVRVRATRAIPMR